MKTTTINSKTSVFEIAKRFIFSFQLLMVGIAIPLLFIIGVSNGSQKKTQENEVNEVHTITHVSPRQVIPFTFARI